MNQEEFELYEKSGMAVADTRGAIELAREEGKEEGRQEGKEEGRQEGKEEGRQEGRTTFLLLMLEAKFGEITKLVRDKVLSADRATLEKWSLQILKSDTLDSVFSV